MRGFQANNCRLCQKVFCCKKCRMKHEKNVHKIFPGCDICVYGKFLFENFGDDFLKHLESSHLPVLCVYCKKIFSSVEDLLQHKKCNFFQTKQLSPKTPFKSTPAILISTDDQDSPILQELQRQEYLNYILATSTPMQRGEEPNLMFEKSKEVITPVDKPSRITNKSIIKNTDSAKSNEQLSKRRVTFGETQANTFEKNMRGSINENHEILPSKVLESLDGQSLNQKSNDNLTPVTGISTGQFYSAKTDVSSKAARDNGNIQNAVDFTPVGIPIRSKLINIKGDIYKNQDQEINDSTGSKNVVAIKNPDNMNEVSMELCTPAKHLNPLENVINGQYDVYKEPIGSDIFLMPEDVKGTQGNGTQNGSNLCTPAKTSNSGKIVVKGDIYKDSEQENMSPIAEVNKQNENSGANNNQNKSLYGLETEEITNTEGHETLWLSAINLEETCHSEQENNKNKLPGKKNEPAQEENSPTTTPDSPQRSNRRRVSIVMPTPILKTTNVQMKFHFPAHLSSTPIMSSGAVKLKQTEIVTDISTRVIQQQTPYKTAQSKLCELVQRKLAGANLRRNLAPLPDIEAGPSTTDKDTSQIENNIKENYSSSNVVVCRDVREPIHEKYDDTYSLISSCEPETGVSVSSMTESNLWSSMTRIVKSVLGGFGSMSQDSSNICTNNNSSSFKRQLSDSDTGDFLEAPRLKRFKFTDIKCRRTIRDLPALDLPRSLPAPAPSLASIEIVKSVSTLYGHQTMRILCDKATQTDHYLMYGWHPHV